MSISCAWISRGRLFVKRDDEDVIEIESDFARNSLERDMRRAGNNAWKGRSGVWGSLGMEPPGAVPWENVEAVRQIRFVSVAPGDHPSEIYYVLDLGAVGGLFSYDIDLEEETRLMHSQAFQARDLSRHPTDRRIAVSVIRDDGTMGLSITRHDGLFGKGVSLSDTIDEAPSWVPDGSAKLVFQSAAIGRNEAGAAVGQSTRRIELLDLEAEQITNLTEEDDFDLLQPRMLSDGSLLYIRRPYRSSHQKPPALLETLQDIVYFPFRLARTAVYFFNFMSMAFSGKPLMTAGLQPQKNQDQDPWLVLYGHTIDTRKAMANGADKDPDRPLVPKDWELIKRSADGRQSVLTSGVASFDADPDGRVVYSNGRGVYLLNEDGKSTMLGKGDLVQKVALLNRSAFAGLEQTSSEA
ncbi:MAG: hypothetical protein NXI04_08770 [Planctomycetaceae bacterium]|nr:hypothetical protein [Planctomycetaceae bacterium]